MLGVTSYTKIVQTSYVIVKKKKICKLIVITAKAWNLICMVQYYHSRALKGCDSEA